MFQQERRAMVTLHTIMGQSHSMRIEDLCSHMDFPSCTLEAKLLAALTQQVEC
eukprot:c4914_g1_i1 orf=275-433(+)